MDPADLYLDRIDLERYFTADQCTRCGAKSCKDLVDRLKERQWSVDRLEFLSRNQSAALFTALEGNRIMPRVEKMQLPQPGPAGLVALNKPGAGDPLLLTGNSRLTQEVLLAVLSESVTPLHVLFVDTRGDTLDMAVILETFTPERVKEALSRPEVTGQAGDGRIVIPGLAGSLEKEIRSAAGRIVETGPVCAAELPLWLGDDWIPA